MKEEQKNISNQSESAYELKQEYLDDLTKKLDNHRSKGKKGLYRYLTGFLLLLLIGTCFFLPKVDLNKSTLIDKNSIVQIQNIEESFIESKEETENNINELGIGSNDLAEESINNESNHLSISQDVSRSVKTDEMIRNSSISNKKSRVISSSKNSSTPSNLNTVNPKQPRKEEDNNVVNKEFILVENFEEDNNKSSDSSNESNNLIINNDQSSSQQKEQLNKSEEEERLDSNLLEGKTESTPEEVDSSFEDSVSNKDTTDVSYSDTSAVKLDTSKIKNRWQLSLLAGANLSFTSFSNYSNQEYFDVRNEEEKPLISFSTGISAERFINKNFKVTSGLQFTSYGSNNKYSPVSGFKDMKQFSGYDSTYTTIMDSIFYTPTRVWLPYLIRIDTTIDSTYSNQKVPNEDSTAYFLQGKVTFSYIEVPLMIGYYKTINKWSFGLNTGVSVGLLTNSSGFFIGEDLQKVEVAKSQKIMWNYLLSPEINYEFKENYYIGFQPYFRLGLNNLSVSEPIDRKYYNLQFNAKIGIRF